jgi:hypothetical protein
MILKIFLSVLVAFFITFTLFYLIIIPIPNTDSKENMSQFFTQNFDDKNKILVLGSSYVGEMNSTYVNKKISQLFPDFVVYNLGYDSDNPNLRIKFLDEIIKLKPTIIFYGISYGDLYIKDLSEKEEPLPNPKLFFHSILKDDIDSAPVNPKHITLKLIKNQFKNLNLFSDSDFFYLPYSPFMTFESYHTIIDTNLHYSTDPQSFDSSKMQNFRNILKKLDKNNIPVVIFTPPHHKSFLKVIPNYEKHFFTSFLLNSTNQFDMDIYNFTDRYQNLSIWRNPSHVAINTESLIYSEDIASMIILELEK